MEQIRTASTPKHRITVIDALRGFALLGVILVHMTQHYGIFSFSGGESREALFPQLDGTVRWIVQNVIMGKFINIFAFLFGLSFFIQMDSAAKKGVDFRMRFLWRMVVLLVIGLIGNSFYTGDILPIYAVFGVLMVFLFRFKNRVLMLLVALLLLGAPRALTVGYQQMTTSEQVETPPSESTQRLVEANVEKPSFFNSAYNNLTDGMRGKLNYQFGLFGRGYITLALFFFGLIVGRLRFFEEVHLHKRLNLILFVGFIAAAISINMLLTLFPETPSAWVLMRGEVGEQGIAFSTFAVIALRDIVSVLFSGAIAMGFIVLYQIKGVERYLSLITPYGRMGLTNYEMQNVIGSIVFSLWGLGTVFGNWGTTEVFMLGLAIYAGQVVVSRVWLTYHLYGPLEWFWRSATYLKWQPFRRK